MFLLHKFFMFWVLIQFIKTACFSDNKDIGFESVG